MALTLRKAYQEGLISSDSYYFAVAKSYGEEELKNLIENWIREKYNFNRTDKKSLRKFLKNEFSKDPNLNRLEGFVSLANKVNHKSMNDTFENCGGIELFHEVSFVGDEEWIDVKTEVVHVLISVAHRIAGMQIVESNPLFIGYEDCEAEFDYTRLYPDKSELYNEGDCDR